MKIGIHFDENGDFVGDFLEGMTLPEGHTLVSLDGLPETLYVGPTKRPKLVDGVVIDQTEAQAEVEELASEPQPPTQAERITELEAENANLSKMQADVVFELMLRGVL